MNSIFVNLFSTLQRVFVNHLSWNVGKSTDVIVRETFKCLEYEYDDIVLYYPKSKLLSAYPNILRVIKAIKRRLTRKDARYDYLLRYNFLANLPELYWGNFDAIYSQGDFPIGQPYDMPVILDSFLIEPENTEELVDKVSKEWYSKTVNRLAIICKRNVIINVRCQYSVNLAKKLFAENARKFVAIPFILPYLKPLSNDKIIEKHKNDRKLKFLFTGAQAKRKGLPIIIKAFQKLYDEGVSNWELNVVSSLDDCSILIDKKYPINLMGAQQQTVVLELAKLSHFYVMVSHSESFGISYIEAEANGCIPLARDYEPQREIVDYGRIGFLSKPNVIEIYKQLKKMLCLNQNDRIHMAIACKDYFVSKYEYSVVVKQWHEAFLKVLKPYE